MFDIEKDFQGQIGYTIDESAPGWPAPSAPPADAPNIVYIVLDDVGYSHLGCYGSPIRTPAMDRLARDGTQFTNFHVTALCSPTRASLLTGRNHHSVGMGTVATFDAGFPARRGSVTTKAATVAEVLRLNGYNTFAVGKWHLTPAEQTSVVGPYTHWPLQRGFDRFYGFHGGWVDQWTPELWYDNHRVIPRGGAGYHLSDDLGERAVEFVNDHLSTNADRRFFLYLSFGACHAPLQAPREYIDHYQGVFDTGWDEYRKRVLARQKELGVLPAQTALVERNPGVQPWKELSDDQQRRFTRWNEVYAGSLEHADHQVGRLLDLLTERGVLNNTLIFVLSDNGASSEGGPEGAVNYQTLQMQHAYHPSDLPIEEYGGPESLGIYPAGWAQAGNTPFKYYKAMTYGGGVRTPLIAHWPAGIARPGHKDHRFRYVTDVTATTLDIVGVELPEQYAGVAQLPMHGHSFRRDLVGDGAAADEYHPPQYFEIFGHRGIWHGGWKALTNHRLGADYGKEPWELYHLPSDPSEDRDLAQSHPELLEGLKLLWRSEATRNGVLPLDDRRGALANVRAPWSPVLQTSHVFYPNATSVPSSCVIDLVNRSYTVTADLETVADGVIIAQGGRFGGYSLFIQDGHPVFDYNNGVTNQTLTADEALPPGPLSLVLTFTKTDEYRGIATLSVGGADLAELELTETMRTTTLMEEGLECGRDELTPVSSRYSSPFAYQGRIARVRIEAESDGGADPAVEFTEAIRRQ